MDLKKRIKAIENSLNLKENPIIVTIVWFGDELPPDQMDGAVAVKFVRYYELMKAKDNEP